MVVKFLRDNFSWVKDVVIVIGIVGMLYLNQNFVTHTKFDNYTKLNDTRMEAIQLAISSLDKSLALLQQNNVILTSLQLDVGKITVTLNDVVQQNKVDAAVNDEVHKYIPHIIQMEASLTQLQKDFEVVKVNGSAITRERLTLLEADAKRLGEEITSIKAHLNKPMP